VVVVDIQGRTLDGRDVEVTTSAAPLRDAEGRLVGVVSILHDQTERNRLERAQAEQAEQLDRIVEGMGEGLFVYDAEGRVVRTNAAARRLLGLDAAPPEFYDLPVEERMARYAPTEADDSLRRLLSPQTWLALREARDIDALSVQEARDIRMRALDGRELEVSASIAPLHDAQGQVVGAVLLLSDRTERNQLAREREAARASELALREVNERLDTFVTMAVHDLRAPLGVSRMVIERAQVLLGRAAEAGATTVRARQARAVAQAVEAVGLTARSLDRLWRLVQQLLDVARVKEGTLVLQRQPVGVVELVRSGVEEQRLLTPSRRIELHVPEAEADSPSGLRVDADPDRLSQVLSNYLANAVRYSPEDQPIDVIVQLEDVVEPVAAEDAGTQAAPVVRVAVRDHGQGIAAEEQATIWERFQRARSASDTQGGLGLGLYIARTIVERHGGQVGVDSEVGTGSTFWFTLPVSHQ
jgi:signal transduction histidine kinase